MKKQHIIIALLAGLVSIMSYGQSLPLTNEAARLCQGKNYEAAKNKIAEAIESENESMHPYAWYVKGFIYKEIYKNTEPNNRQSKNRELAAESFLKSLEVDKYHEHTSMTKEGLKFLATTYYNDALLRTRDFDLSNATEPEGYFNTFRKLMRTTDPIVNLSTYDKEFSKSMAQRYFSLWQLDLNNDALPEKAQGFYASAVRLDSLDGDTYYNIAVIYYNKAVFKYRKLNADTDIFDLIVIQQECADLIKNKALPNMNRAYKLLPERGDVVRGLMFIHRALEHENDVEYFKSEIERLINEGKISDPKK